MQPAISLQVEFELPTAGASTQTFCKKLKPHNILEKMNSLKKHDKKRATALTISALVGVSAMSQLPAAVIFNSGFEAPIVASPYNYLTGSQLDGWNIVGRVLHFDSSYRPVGGDRYSIQFDESTIGISQSFPTTVGGLYFVNFDLSAWDFVGSSGRSGGVRAGLIESYSLFESTGSMAFSEEFIGYSDAYVEQTYYFTATSATTTLGFTSSRLYPHLDNVEVFPIPEPSASLIFVVSAISTLAFRRRLRPSSHAPE